MGRASDRCTEVSLDPADLERLVDHRALQEGLIREDTVFAEVSEILDGPKAETGYGPVLREALRKILQLRLADADAFDLLALKVLAPDLTHSDLTQAANALGRVQWSHRARSCESLRRLVARFPELEGVLSWDRRGGDRHRRVTQRQLLAEYGALKAAERGKPMARRRRCLGEGGLLAELAERHGIRGVVGKPAWEVVRWLLGEAGRSARN